MATIQAAEQLVFAIGETAWNWPNSWQRAIGPVCKPFPPPAGRSNAGSPKRRSWWMMTMRSPWRAEFAPAIRSSSSSGRKSKGTISPPAPHLGPLPAAAGGWSGEGSQFRREVAQLNDDLAANSLLAPAQELLALEEQLIHKSSDRNRDMADRVAFGLWLLGACGAVAGLVAGFGIARGISHSIVNLYVPIRAASGRLEEVIRRVDIAPARGIEHLDEILRSMADHVGTSWTACNRPSTRSSARSRCRPWGSLPPGWPTSCAIR